MLFLWALSFAVGCLVAAIVYRVKRKRVDKELAEQMMLQAAILEAGCEKVQALCTTLGFTKAYEMILIEYKNKHHV